MAVAVVLARCSAPERARSIADSGAIGGTHSTGCRARFSMFSGRPCGLRACSCCMRQALRGQLALLCSTGVMRVVAWATVVLAGLLALAFLLVFVELDSTKIASKNTV